MLKTKILENTVMVNSCWEWQRTRNNCGYGRVTVQGKKVLVHRLAYELWVGPIPRGLVVRHRCDNPACCNPAHLEVGTRRENTQDMMRRGRWSNGCSTSSDIFSVS
jgi:hypothetical protein